MIHALVIINNFGKPRLSKFYTRTVRALPVGATIQPSTRASAAQVEPAQQQFMKELFAVISTRQEGGCSFVDASRWFDAAGARVIYRQVAQPPRHARATPAPRPRHTSAPRPRSTRRCSSAWWSTRTSRSSECST